MRIREDLVVYGVPHRHAYLARFEDLGWVTWPAEQDGWRLRQPGDERMAEPCSELPPGLGELALRLSGVLDPRGREG